MHFGSIVTCSNELLFPVFNLIETFGMAEVGRRVSTSIYPFTFMVIAFLITINFDIC